MQAKPWQIAVIVVAVIVVVVVGAMWFTKRKAEQTPTIAPEVMKQMEEEARKSGTMPSQLRGGPSMVPGEAPSGGGTPSAAPSPSGAPTGAYRPPSGTGPTAPPSAPSSGR